MPLDTEERVHRPIAPGDPVPQPPGPTPPTPAPGPTPGDPPPAPAGFDPARFDPDPERVVAELIMAAFGRR